MRKNKLLILSSVLLLGLSLASCNKFTNQSSNSSGSVSAPSVDITEVPTPSVIPSNPSVLPDFKFEGYYSSITNEMLSSSTTLKAELNKIVSSNTTFVSYAGALGALKTIDSYDGDYVECIYTGERLGKDNSGSASGQWNREHIWAKSHGFNDSKYEAYSDLHHLRVSEARINTARNNSYFDEVLEPTKTDDYGNKWTSEVFEPRDEVKGDIARMLLYMVIRYDNDVLDLELTNDKELASKAETGKSGYIGILNTMLKWNYQDPVDSRELYRNEEIYKVQGNRNPFIDHPELAYYLYKDECQSQSITEATVKSSITITMKDDEKISSVNNKIKAIGSVSLESKGLIEAAEAEYNSLDDVSKSFVSEYDILQKARYDYNVLQSLNNQDKTISTTIDVTKVSDKTGSYALNGIELSYSAPYVYDGKGIYSQTGKNVILTVKNLYDAIKNIELSFTSNKPNSTTPAGVATITISDGENTVSFTTEVLDKSSNHLARIDVSSLDMSKDIVITISSDFSSAILQEVKFSVI